MWKLKIAKGQDDRYLYSTNNYIGRQIWEFDPNAGTIEEQAKIEEARQHYWNNRYKVKPNSDLLWRMQVSNYKGRLDHKVTNFRSFLVEVLSCVGYKVWDKYLIF